MVSFQISTFFPFSFSSEYINDTTQYFFVDPLQSVLRWEADLSVYTPDMMILLYIYQIPFFLCFCSEFRNQALSTFRWDDSPALRKIQQRFPFPFPFFYFSLLLLMTRRLGIWCRGEKEKEQEGNATTLWDSFKWAKTWQTLGLARAATFIIKRSLRNICSVLLSCWWTTARIHACMIMKSMWKWRENLQSLVFVCGA